MVLDWQGFATGEQEVREEVRGHRIFQKKGSCSMDLAAYLSCQSWGRHQIHLNSGTYHRAWHIVVSSRYLWKEGRRVALRGMLLLL